MKIEYNTLDVSKKVYKKTRNFKVVKHKLGNSKIFITKVHIKKIYLKRRNLLYKYIPLKLIKDSHKINGKCLINVEANLVGNLLKLYMKWVVEQCINGHIVKLLNTQYYLKVYKYIPTQAELDNIKELNQRRLNLYNNAKKRGYDKTLTNVDTTTPCLISYKGYNYRIGLFKIINNRLVYANYFFRLSKNYKFILKDKIKENPNIYEYSTI